MQKATRPASISGLNTGKTVFLSNFHHINTKNISIQIIDIEIFLENINISNRILYL